MNSVGSSLFLLVTVVNAAWAQPKHPLRALPVNEDLASPSVPKQSKLFLIMKTEWDEEDEAEFSELIAAIGASNCRSFIDCLKHPANFLRDSDPPDLRALSDCADFPLMLRAYYAWKRGLPFSVASAIRTSDPPPEPGKPPTDFRYTVSGNQIATRKSFTAREVRDVDGKLLGAHHPTIEDIWDHIHNVVSSSMYRTDPRDEDTKRFSDFYSPTIDRNHIKAGTVLYAPQGHVALVHKVDSNGDVNVVQDSTDGIISRINFNKNSFPQSRISHGAGFKNWRPQKLVGATRNAAGYYIGGTIEAATNEELRKQGKFSMDQYRSQGGKYEHSGQELAWEDFVAARLSGKPWKRDPIGDFSKRIQALCSQVQNRVRAVAAAVERGLPNQPHPEKLPTNIFGADQPDWESFSSPGRDADLRAMMSDLVSFSRDMNSLSPDELKKTAYTGANLNADMQKEFRSQSESCKIEYINSRGRKVPLSLTDVINRAEKLSFDPYHCPELRWGAEGAEAESCKQHPSSAEWYVVQRPLRQQKSRDTGGFYGYTLEEAKKAFKSMEVKETDFNVATTF
jgi:hypothetical protein